MTGHLPERPRRYPPQGDGYSAFDDELYQDFTGVEPFAPTLLDRFLGWLARKIGGGR